MVADKASDMESQHQQQQQQEEDGHRQHKAMASSPGSLEKTISSKGLFERIVAKSYLPFMSTGFDVGFLSVRPGSLLLVVTMVIVAVQGAYFAFQLTPPNKVESFVPDNHMSVDFNKYSSSVTFSPDHERYAIMGVFWGIQGLDTDSLDVYKPDDFEGGTVFDGSFDLSNPDAQALVLETCQKLRTLLCTEDACENSAYTERTLMMQSSEKTWSCFLEDPWESLLHPRSSSATLSKRIIFLDWGPKILLHPGKQAASLQYTYKRCSSIREDIRAWDSPVCFGFTVDYSWYLRWGWASSVALKHTCGGSVLGSASENIL